MRVRNTLEKRVKAGVIEAEVAPSRRGSKSSPKRHNILQREIRCSNPCIRKSLGKSATGESVGYQRATVGCLPHIAVGQIALLNINIDFLHQFFFLLYSPDVPNLEHSNVRTKCKSSRVGDVTCEMKSD